MGKRLSIEAHLTAKELEQRYRTARDGVERSQWQIIWLLAGGATSQGVAAVTGYSLPWIRELAKRANAGGAGTARAGGGPSPLSMDVPAGLRLSADRADPLVAAAHHQPAGVRGGARRLCRGRRRRPAAAYRPRPGSGRLAQQPAASGAGGRTSDLVAALFP